MSVGSPDFEALLREALSPVDPPDDLLVRVESTLVSLAVAAHDELEAWELSAMRDPRNWVRPAAAIIVGAGAGAALVVLRVRTRHPSRLQRSANMIELAGHTLHDVAEEARRVLPGR
jgi:hypothetical protein